MSFQQDLSYAHHNQDDTNETLSVGKRSTSTHQPSASKNCKHSNKIMSRSSSRQLNDTDQTTVFSVQDENASDVTSTFVPLSSPSLTKTTTSIATTTTIINLRTKNNPVQLANDIKVEHKTTSQLVELPLQCTDKIVFLREVVHYMINQLGSDAFYMLKSGKQDLFKITSQIEIIPDDSIAPIDDDTTVTTTTITSTFSTLDTCQITTTTKTVVQNNIFTDIDCETINCVSNIDYTDAGTDYTHARTDYTNVDTNDAEPPYIHIDNYTTPVNNAESVSQYYSPRNQSQKLTPQQLSQQFSEQFSQLPQTSQSLNSHHSETNIGQITYTEMFNRSEKQIDEQLDEQL